MRPFEEIEKDYHITVIDKGADGGCGMITIPTFQGTVVWSNGGGWEHVSVSPYKKRYLPSWDDMCKVKDIFFKDDEWVCQFHPAKNDYVNNVGNCLHLWRPIDEKLPTPPSWMTGVKMGQTIDGLIKEIKGYVGRK